MPRPLVFQNMVLRCHKMWYIRNTWTADGIFGLLHHHMLDDIIHDIIICDIFAITVAIAVIIVATAVIIANIIIKCVVTISDIATIANGGVTVNIASEQAKQSEIDINPASEAK